MTLKLYTTRWDCDSSEGRLQGTPHPPQRPPYRACTRHGRLQSLVMTQDNGYRSSPNCCDANDGKSTASNYTNGAQSNKRDILC